MGTTLIAFYHIGHPNFGVNYDVYPIGMNLLLSKTAHYRLKLSAFHENGQFLTLSEFTKEYYCLIVLGSTEEVFVIAIRLNA